MTAVVRPVPPVLGTAATHAASDFDVSGAARKAPFGPARQQPYHYDDFDRPDGALNGMVTPTGLTWGTGGAGYLTTAIVNRRVYGTANTYPWLDYGGPFTRIGGTFIFRHGLGTDDRAQQTLVLIAGTTPAVLDYMLHLLISPTSWAMMAYSTSTGGITVIASGTHDLLSDTPYSIAYEIDAIAHTCTIYLPQGAPITVYDADIGVTINPTAGCWQIGPITNGSIGEWLYASMGPDQQGRAAAALGAAPAAEVGWLRGDGLTRRQRVKATLTGGPGWYRIATDDAGSIVGTVSLSAADLYSHDTWRFSASGVQNAPPLVLQTIVKALYATPTIDEVRLSRDDSSYHVALDVHVLSAYGGTVSLTIEFEGGFTVVSLPVVGATALLTESVVLAYAGTGVYWDGTRWLGPEQRIALPHVQVENVGDHRHYAGDQAELFEWALPSRDILITAVDIVCLDQDSAPSTTNYHELTLVDGTASTVYVATTEAIAQGVWTKMVPAGGYSLPVVFLASNLRGVFNLRHVGTNGGIYVASPVITFREIVT